MRYDLDITKEHCPMTFVKTKLKLASLPEGARLFVTLLKGEPLDNLPKAVTEQGYVVHGINPLYEDTYVIEIEKPFLSTAG